MSLRQKQPAPPFRETDLLGEMESFVSALLRPCHDVRWRWDGVGEGTFLNGFSGGGGAGGWVFWALLAGAALRLGSFLEDEGLLPW